MHSHFEVGFPEEATDLDLALVRTYFAADAGPEGSTPPSLAWPYRYHFLHDHIDEPLTYEFYEKSRNAPFCVALSNMNAYSPVAVKVMVNGVNIISGEQEALANYPVLRAKDPFTGARQNFIEVIRNQTVYGQRIDDETVAQLVITSIRTSPHNPTFMDPLFGHIEFIIIPTVKQVAQRRMKDVLHPNIIFQQPTFRIPAWNIHFHYRAMFHGLPVKVLKKALSSIQEDKKPDRYLDKLLLANRLSETKELNPNRVAELKKEVCAEDFAWLQTKSVQGIPLGIFQVRMDHVWHHPRADQTTFLERTVPYKEPVKWQEVPFIDPINRWVETRRTREIASYRTGFFQEGVTKGRPIKDKVVPSIQPVQDYDRTKVKYLKVIFKYKDESDVRKAFETRTPPNSFPFEISECTHICGWASFYNIYTMPRAQNVLSALRKFNQDQKEVRAEEEANRTAWGGLYSLFGEWEVKPRYELKDNIIVDTLGIEPAVNIKPKV